MKLYDGQNLTRIAENASVTFDLHAGSIRAYRYGITTQATLAEFSVDAFNKTWFDISIIPTGPLSGPKHCMTLEDCKTLTGGVGFNVPLQITPKVTYASDNCRKLVCLADGCDDAYQFPQQDEKTHSCGAGVEFQVVFCPSTADTETDWSLPGYWVDDDASKKALESGVLVGDTNSVPTVTTSAPTPAVSEVITRSTSADDSSAAAYVAGALGGTVVCIVCVALIVRYRRRVVADVHYHWPDRRSSDAISFVSAKDII
ncbi:hypothetical protein FI667_g12665, partial [Globisporangium splendens]